MAKEFKKWIDEFVENGANPKNVVNWPEEAGGGSGTRVVSELPETGEEHIIYELQEKKKIPSLIPMFNQQMVNDGVFNELMLFTFVFDTSEDMTNTLNPIIPEGKIPFYMNYIIKEDKLIMSEYDGAKWQFAEVTKVSDYKFDLSSAFGGSSAYLVMLKEYLGKTSEESGDIRYTGKLLNDELYTFGANTFCIVLGAPTSGIMALNTLGEFGIQVPEEYTFEYIPYEKILKNQLSEMFDGINVLWVFKPKGTGEITVPSYWIYANKKWFNADDIRPIKLQDKIVEHASDTQKITADFGYDGLGTVTVPRSKGACSFTTLSVTLPLPLEDMGVGQVGSNIYLFGGRSEYNDVNTIYKFDATTETISTLSVTLPRQLNGMGVGQVGSNIYLFGGYSDDSQDTIYKFDATTETISTLSVKLPRQLNDMGVGQVGSNIYLFGGYSHGSQDTIYKFDAESETISTLSVTLPKKIEGVKAVSIGSNIYLFGGFYSDIIYKFNTETETIITLSATLIRELNAIGVASIGSNIYLFGGYSRDSNGLIYEDAVCEFDATTETISTKSVTLPRTLYWMGVGQVGSNIYLFGGQSFGTLKTIYKFNISF